MNPLLLTSWPWGLYFARRRHPFLSSLWMIYWIGQNTGRVVQSLFSGPTLFQGWEGTVGANKSCPTKCTCACLHLAWSVLTWLKGILHLAYPRRYIIILEVNIHAERSYLISGVMIKVPCTSYRKWEYYAAHLTIRLGRWCRRPRDVPRFLHMVRRQCWKTQPGNTGWPADLRLAYLCFIPRVWFTPPPRIPLYSTGPGASILAARYSFTKERDSELRAPVAFCNMAL